MTPVRLYTVKGLGGTFGLFDQGILDCCSECLAIPGIRDGGVYTFPQRDYLVAQIRNDRAANPSLKIAIIAHSLGCVTAMSVTDYMPVDLIAAFDCAGGAPSRAGRNTKLCLDFRDVAGSIAPDFEIRAVPGFESRIRHYIGNMGHVQCPYNLKWRTILRSELAILAK